MKLWEDVYHNPVRLLHQLDRSRLDEVAEDAAFIEKFDQVISAFDHYMAAEDNWFLRIHGQDFENPIAYFSLEFGIHECLPIYSGGLGILAGDHLKSASDLGIPMIGLGLLYRESYFTQFISMHGHQQVVYLHNDFSTMALTSVKDETGDILVIRVKLDHREVAARVWHAKVGRVDLYLLDTDFSENPVEDRQITERLYAEDRDNRLVQEMMLGIGGVTALDAMGILPSVWHMNEGHCSFMAVERIRRFLQQGVSMDDAIDRVRSSTVFTTHTPVPAGHEVFECERIERFLGSYCESMGMTKDQFCDFARIPGTPDPNAFNMTVFALRLSGHANAVSKLHGEVARRMWHGVWPKRPISDIPIIAITNGIHARTWLTSQMKNLFDETVGQQWRYELMNKGFWEKIYDIPDEVLWSVHHELKTALIEVVRERLVTQRERNGESKSSVDQASRILDPNLLTIGFARRFASYKRATLIFRHRDKLRDILVNSDRPVQMLFAGKSHPANQPGKELIQQIYGESRNPDFQGRIVFIEDYDMAFAKRMVSGVDVWLNTPRRPHEASGTSGMKVAMNGGLNLSILDGWWREGYDGKNGWAIGEDKEYYNEVEQDDADSRSLYRILEEEIIPLFYERDEQNLPGKWISRMKESMRGLIPVYNTDRMLNEYMEQLYLKCLK